VGKVDGDISARIRYLVPANDKYRPELIAVRIWIGEWIANSIDSSFYSLRFSLRILGVLCVTVS
jgi:hypothetical protein